MRELTPAVRAFVRAWADDEWWTGHILGTLVGHFGPEPEESIAMGSLSQDDLGQARMLYLILTGTDREMDRLIFECPAVDLRCSWLTEAWERQDWAYVVIKFLLYEEAEALRIAAVAGSDDAEWAQIARTFAREESLHRSHWTEWLRLLAGDALEGRPRLQAALEQIWPVAFDFFDDPLWARAAADLHLPVRMPADLQAQWLANVTVLLQRYGLRIPAQRGLADNAAGGRYGRRMPCFGDVLSRARSIYALDPTAVWG